MTDEPSFVQLVTQALISAGRPLTVAEIIARVEMVRPVRTRNPRSTIRNAINNIPLAASLGGRPARYTWWPRHLADNSFRQPLSGSDLQAGTLVLGGEAWLALWPDFYNGPSCGQGEVTVVLNGGPVIQTRIEHLVTGQAVWGLSSTPALAEWYRQQEATSEDDLILRVLDVDARRYAVELCRRADRDEAAIATRNRALADAAEAILRAGRPPMPDFYLVPRLIAHDAYRSPVPPDPWERVLRADLRFVVDRRSVDLAEKIVDYLEREEEVPSDPYGSPRPRGDRRKLYLGSALSEIEGPVLSEIERPVLSEIERPVLSEIERPADGARPDELQRAWGEYLFDRGMDHLWAGWPLAAEAYYQEALRLDPGHADAWVHLGNLSFEERRVAEALAHYERGQAAAEARTIGDPAHYPAPFWLDVDSRPYMRALHGRGLCLWRLGRVDEARQVFAWMLELNPNDNQGARFLLHDLDEGLSWEESAARDEAQEKERSVAFRLAQIWGSQPDDVIH